MKLGEALNTHNLALNEIAALGFSIRYETDEENEDWGEWRAVRGNLEVYASNPLSLLALCFIADKHGEGWRTAPQEPLYDQIMAEDT